MRNYPIWVTYEAMPDDLDSFALDRTRNYANWLNYGARNLAQDAKTLMFWTQKITTQRPFETMAEEAMDNAEKALINALESVRKARDHYKTIQK